jgi:hypothetical protein
LWLHSGTGCGLGLGLWLSHQFRCGLRRRFGLQLRLLGLLYPRLYRRIGPDKRLRRRFHGGVHRSFHRECPLRFVTEQGGERHCANHEREREAHQYNTHLQERVVPGPPVIPQVSHTREMALSTQDSQ